MRACDVECSLEKSEAYPSSLKLTEGSLKFVGEGKGTSTTIRKLKTLLEQLIYGRQLQLTSFVVYPLVRIKEMISDDLIHFVSLFKPGRIKVS